MRIAVMSDTHDQINNLVEAIEYCNHNEISAVIHCGDLISPFMLKQLNKFRGTTHLIYGNNIGDLHLISQMCVQDFPDLNHHGVQGTIKIAGRRIGFHHYPEVARAMATQNIYDIVCCGHNHIYGVEEIGSTLLVNPGDLLGKNIKPCFCIVESKSLQIEKIEIGRPMFPAK